MKTLKSKRILAALVVAALLIALGSLAGLGYYDNVLSSRKLAEPYPAQNLVDKVEELLQAGETGQPLQAAIDAGMIPEIISFFVIDAGGKILAAYPPEEIGKYAGLNIYFPGVYFSKDTRIPPGGSVIEISGWPRLLYQGVDPDSPELSHFYNPVINNDDEHFLLAGAWRMSDAFTREMRGIRTMLNLFDGLFRIGFILYWILLAYWVYRDARERDANGLGWGILTLLTNAVGWAVYMIARPKLVQCPACRRYQKAEAKVCPDCGYRLQAVCPACRARVEERWTFCANCGEKVAPAD